MMKNNKISTKISLSLVLILFITLMFYFYQFNPSKKEGVFLRCPSNLIFGFNCPGCGSQRALHYILHFDIPQALTNNALFVIAFPFVLYYSFVYWKKKWYGNEKTTPFLTHRYVIIGLLIIITLFGILRNIPIYPFTLLAP